MEWRQDKFKRKIQMNGFTEAVNAIIKLIED